MTIVPAITTFLGLIAFLVVTKFQRGRLLAPMSVALLMMISIFGVRPLLLMGRGEYGFYGADSELGFRVAANVGLFALFSLLCGYMLASTRDKGARPRSVASAQRPTLRRVGLALTLALGVVLLWFVVMAIVGGGGAFIALLFAGRSEEVATRLENVPAIVPALPVVAALIAANVRLDAVRRNEFLTKHAILYWVVIAAAVIPPAALGTRRFIIPSLIAGALGVVAARWYRPISLRMVAAVIVGFLLLAILPFVRSAGSRTGSSDLVGAMFEYFATAGVSGVLDSFFLSYDTEMFNYIAYVAPFLGDEIPYGYGRMVIGDLVLAPIPAALSPMETWANQVLTYLFGGGCSEVYCPVPSLPGALFFDGGFLAVVIGMFVAGWGVQRFERNFLSSSGLKLTALLVAAAFTIQIFRGNPASQIWIAIQVFALVAITLRVARKSPQGDRARADAVGSGLVAE